MKAGDEMQMTRLLTLAAEAELMTRERPERPEMLQVGRPDTAAR